MSFFAGLAHGINEGLTGARAEEAAQNERDATRENAVLTHLATSDDPEIASMAIAGLTDQAAGRKPAKGLRGWMGAMQGNPALPRIRDLMAAGKQQTTTEGGPTYMAPQGAAAMPMGSPVQPGEGPPGMSTAAIHNSLPQDPGQQVTRTVPRTVFLSPAEKARQEESATLEAKLGAFRQARTPEEQALIGGSAVAGHTVFGGYQTVNGQRMRRMVNMTSGEETYLPVDEAGTPKDSMMGEPGTGKPVIMRTYPDGTQKKLGYGVVKNGYATYTDPDTQEQRSVVLPASYQAPPSGAPGASATPPPGAAAVPTATPPPAAAAPSPQAAAGQAMGTATPPPGVTAPTGKKGPGGIDRGRSKSLTETKGAVIGADGLPQAVTAQYDKGTGKYYNPADGSAYTGFIPGDEGTQAVQAFSNGQATISKIDAALDAIKKSGYADSKDPKDTLTLWRMYRGGANPASDAFGSLTSLAGLAGASQYVKSNSRSFQMFQRAAEHTAKLPTDMQAGWSNVPGVSSLITPDNAMRAGSQPWDSPAALVAKLTTSRDATVQALDALRQAAGKVPARGVGGAPPAAGGAPTAPAATTGGVPPEVQQALAGVGSGKHTLSDGSVWIKNPDGSVTKGQ